MATVFFFKIKFKYTYIYTVYVFVYYTQLIVCLFLQTAVFQLVFDYFFILSICILCITAL